MKVAIFLNSGSKVNFFEGADKVVCADGGMTVCPVTPHLLVGDFDSFSSTPEGVEIIRHNPKKNDTDGTLAVKSTIEKFGADAIDFYGVFGGRQDHVLGNLTLLALADSLGAKARAVEKDFVVHFERGVGCYHLPEGTTLSILPYGGSATVTESVGLEYPLDNLTLTPIDTRGVSNVTCQKTVSFKVTQGAVLVFCHKSQQKIK